MSVKDTIVSANVNVGKPLERQIGTNAIYGIGKTTTTALNGGAGIGQAGGIFAGLGPSVGAISALGVTAALSAGITQMDYHHKRHETREMYREEIAARLGKDPKQVKSKDLDLVANGDPGKGIVGNRIIAEDLNKARKERNLNVALSITASLASLVIVGGIMSAGVLPLMPLWAEVLTHGAMGLIGYNVVKMPLHWIGDKIFGIKEQTTQEKIELLAKDHQVGRVITQEQVFGIFASANPELQAMIKRKFGKEYDQLDPASRRQMADSVGKLMHVDHIAADINEGKVRVTELAFAAEGEASGVLPKMAGETAQKSTWVGAIKNKWHDIVGHFSGSAKEQPAVEYNNEAPERSFASRVNRAPVADISHVEQLEQSRGELPLQQR